MSTLLEMALEFGGTTECPECDGIGQLPAGVVYQPDELHGHLRYADCWLCHGAGRVEDDPVGDREPAS